MSDLLPVLFLSLFIASSALISFTCVCFLVSSFSVCCVVSRFLASFSPLVFLFCVPGAFLYFVLWLYFWTKFGFFLDAPSACSCSPASLCFSKYLKVQFKFMQHNLSVFRQNTVKQIIRSWQWCVVLKAGTSIQQWILHLWPLQTKVTWNWGYWH